MIILSDYTTLPRDLFEHLKVSNVFWDIFRDFGYSLLKGLAKLVDGVYDAVNTILSLDLYTLVKTKFPTFFNAVPSLVWVAFGLAIMIGGLKLASKRNKGESSKFIESMFSSALLIVAFPFLINALSDLRTAGIDDVNALKVGNGSIGEEILSNLVIDIDNSKYKMTYISENTNKSAYSIDINEELDNSGFWDKKVGTKPLSNQRVTDYVLLVEFFGCSENVAKNFVQYGSYNTDRMIDIFAGAVLNELEAIERSKNNTNLADQIHDCDTISELFYIFDYQIQNWKKYRPPLSSDVIQDVSLYTNYLFTEDDYEKLSWNEKIVETIKSLGSPEENLYAYDFFFLNALIILTTTLVALIFAGLKASKLLYDMIFNQIIGQLVIATDLNNEGRKKYIIQQIISTYLVFIVILFIIKLFLVVTLYITTTQFSIVVQLFIILGGMAFIIDGPDTIVKLLGIDAGVKNGGHAIYAVNSAARIGRGAVAAVGAVAAASSRTVGRVAGGVLSSFGREGGNNHSEATAPESSAQSGHGSEASSGRQAATTTGESSNNNSEATAPENSAQSGNGSEASPGNNTDSSKE